MLLRRTSVCPIPRRLGCIETESFSLEIVVAAFRCNATILLLEGTIFECHWAAGRAHERSARVTHGRHPCVPKVSRNADRPPIQLRARSHPSRPLGHRRYRKTLHCQGCGYPDRTRALEQIAVQLTWMGPQVVDRPRLSDSLESETVRTPLNDLRKRLTTRFCRQRTLQNPSPNGNIFQPKAYRLGRKIMIRTDSAGGTHGFLDWLTA